MYSICLHLISRFIVFPFRYFLLFFLLKVKRSVDQSTTMTKAVAYTKPLTCKMWKLFGKYASKHGYQAANGHNCSEYSDKDAIQDVRVGPWVSLTFSYF